MSRPMNDAPQGLTTTSYAVLAQLAVHPWSTYELARQRVRYFRYVWPRAESAIYREVKRLAAMELVTAKREYVGKRPRTLYSITEAGRQTLREWLATPVSPFAMDFEAMIRLFIAPLGTKEQLVATLEQVRDDAQEMLRFSGAVKQEFLDGRAVLQDQVYIRAHAVDFFISLLSTVDGWAERTLAEIQGWKDLSPDGKNDRGLQLMAQLPAPAPVSTPSAHWCRLEPSGDGDRLGKEAQSKAVSDAGRRTPTARRPCRRDLGQPQRPRQRRNGRTGRRPLMADHLPAPAVSARTQPGRARVITSQAIPGQPGQAQHQPADRAGEAPAQANAVPAQPPRRLPGPHRPRPHTLM